MACPCPTRPVLKRANTVGYSGVFILDSADVTGEIEADAKDFARFAERRQAVEGSDIGDRGPP